MRVLVFSDPHNADNPPRMRKEGYREEILEKQRLLIPISKECDLTVCTGDVFHSKRAEHVSYKLMNEICEIYREFPRMLIVPGNHDIDTRMDWSDRPLGILAKLPNIRVLHNATFKYGAFDVAFKLWGGGEFFSVKEMMGFMEDSVKGTSKVIAVVHASIAEGMYYPFEYTQISSIVPFCDFLILGHLHDFQYARPHCLATGGLSRGVLTFDANLLRPVYYGIVEVGEDIQCELCDIPVKPAEEVFKVEKKVLEGKQKETVDGFVEFIQNLKIPKNLNREDAIVYIKQLSDVKEEVKREAIKVLEEL